MMFLKNPGGQVDHFWIFIIFFGGVISFHFLKSKHMLFRLDAKMDRTGSDSCAINRQPLVAFCSHVCWEFTAPLKSVDVLGFFVLFH